MQHGTQNATASILFLAMLLAPGLGSLAHGAPEPNNTFAEAISIDSDSASFTGTLTTGDNADMFKILLNRTGSSVEAVDANLTKTSSGGEVRLYLYDEDGYRLAWNATVGDASIESSVCAPYTGYVYIVVLFLLGAASVDYELNVTKSNTTSNLDRLDGNNRPSEAVPVQDGSTVDKEADAFYNPGDFYSLQLDVQPGYRDILTVLVAVPPSADFMVELFHDGNSSYIDFADTGDIFNPDFGVNETLYFVPHDAGQYMMRVWAEHGAGNYSMAVGIFQSTLDTNNDMGNATQITPGSTLKDGVSMNFDPDDYYRMQLRPDTELNVSLTADWYNSSFRVPDLDLYIMDSDRNVLNSSTASGQYRALGCDIVSAGWYYIRVFAGTDSAGNYTMNVSTVEPPLVPQSIVNLTMPEDGTTTIDLGTIFLDQGGRPLSFNFTPSVHLILSLDGANLTIQPAPLWHGHAVIGVSAANLELKVSTAEINLTVTHVNHPPSATQHDLSFTTEADQNFTLTISVFSLFVDPDGDNLIYSVSGNRNLTVFIDADGLITVTPPLYWWGVETFSMFATDPSGADASVSVTIIVTAVNHFPLVVWTPGNITFPEHGNATVNLTMAFRDPDNDNLTFSVQDNMVLQVTIVNGTARVEPIDPNWYGNESIIFVAADPYHLTASILVNFSVTMVNDPPYAFRPVQNQTIRENVPTTIFNLNTYFRDPHSDLLGFAATGYSNITVNISADGWVTVTPDTDWHNGTSMRFTATDPGGLSTSLLFNLTVLRVDKAPLLSGMRVTPSKGDTSTTFEFIVVVKDVDSASVNVSLTVGKKSMVMERITGGLAGGATYRVRTALPRGDNVFYFQADDGEGGVNTTSSLDVNVADRAPNNTLLYISLLILIIVIVALALAFSPTRGRGEFAKDEEE